MSRYDGRHVCAGFHVFAFSPRRQPRMRAASAACCQARGRGAHTELRMDTRWRRHSGADEAWDGGKEFRAASAADGGREKLAAAPRRKSGVKKRDGADGGGSRADERGDASAGEKLALSGEGNGSSAAGAATNVRRMSFKKSAPATPPSLRTSTLTASWGGELLARTPQYAIVDGYFLFPPHSVRTSALVLSFVGDRTKRRQLRRQHNPLGRAEYYDIVVYNAKGKLLRRNRGAAWTYPKTKGAWQWATGWWAFYKGVRLRMQNGVEELGEDVDGG